MGYYIHSSGCHISIPADKIKPCLDAIQQAINDDRPHLGSVSEKNVLAALAKGDLKEIFSEYGYEMTDDGAGGLELDYYSGEKYYSEMGEIIAMAAPVLEDGSYVEFEGEEFDKFRFYVEGGKCYEQNARIEVIWPEKVGGKGDTLVMEG